MSDFPCSSCRATNRGRLTFIYVNHYDGDELVKRRCRLCRDCVIDLMPPLLDGADYKDDTGEWIPCDVASHQGNPPATKPSTQPAQPAANKPSGPKGILTTTATMARNGVSAGRAQK